MRFEKVAKSGKDGQDEVLVYSIEGELFKGTASYELEKAIKEDIKTGHRLFVFNLANLTYTNSSGIGSLIAIRKRITEQQGNCYLAEMNASVASVFLGLSLFKIFPYAENVDIAVDLLTSQNSAQPGIPDSSDAQAATG